MYNTEHRKWQDIAEKTNGSNLVPFINISAGLHDRQYKTSIIAPLGHAPVKVDAATEKSVLAVVEANLAYIMRTLSALYKINYLFTSCSRVLKMTDKLMFRCSYSMSHTDLPYTYYIGCHILNSIKRQ